MVVSASKQKRMAAKAAKAAKKDDTKEVEKSMKQLKLEAVKSTDRSATGVLTSNFQGRDIHIDSFTLSFHGRMLIENAS
ncbi:ABC transporter ATP-binding protein arb1, partial [Coemansia sp. RSA 2708]